MRRRRLPSLLALLAAAAAAASLPDGMASDGAVDWSAARIHHGKSFFSGAMAPISGYRSTCLFPTTNNKKNKCSKCSSLFFFAMTSTTSKVSAWATASNAPRPHARATEAACLRASH